MDCSCCWHCCFCVVSTSFAVLRSVSPAAPALGLRSCPPAKGQGHDPAIGHCHLLQSHPVYQGHNPTSSQPPQVLSLGSLQVLGGCVPRSLCAEKGMGPHEALMAPMQGSADQGGEVRGGCAIKPTGTCPHRPHHGVHSHAGPAGEEGRLPSSPESSEPHLLRHGQGHGRGPGHSRAEALGNEQKEGAPRAGGERTAGLEGCRPRAGAQLCLG